MKQRATKLICFSSIVVSIGCVCALTHILFAEETIFVKYRGSVNLTPFTCEFTPRSSVVKRLCYDTKEQYVVVNLSGTYYHYCEVPKDVVREWRNAESLGRYYNQHIKGRYDCRILHVPQYKK